MTNEEIQKTMEFILEQQAQLLRIYKSFKKRGCVMARVSDA